MVQYCIPASNKTIWWPLTDVSADNYEDKQLAEACAKEFSSKIESKSMTWPIILLVKRDNNFEGCYIVCMSTEPVFKAYDPS